MPRSVYRNFDLSDRSAPSSSAGFHPKCGAQVLVARCFYDFLSMHRDPVEPLGEFPRRRYGAYSPDHQAISAESADHAGLVGEESALADSEAAKSLSSASPLRT